MLNCYIAEIITLFTLFKSTGLELSDLVEPTKLKPHFIELATHTLKCSTCRGACLGNMPPECLDTRSLLSWRFFNDYHPTLARLVSISPRRRGQWSAYRSQLLVSHSHSPLVEWLALHVPSASFFHEVVNCLCLPLANTLSNKPSPLQKGGSPLWSVTLCDHRVLL